MALSEIRENGVPGGFNTPDWRVLGCALAVAIGTLVMFGTMAVGSSAPYARIFDLDRELNLVVAFSTALLFANGYLLYQISARRGLRPAWLLGMGAFFVFMGLDELLKIHETLEKLLQVDWQLLYLPLALVAAPLWLYVLLRNDGVGKVIWSGGAMAWVSSQLLEAVQWSPADEKVANYDALMLSEECLEMTGSALFLLALYRWWRSAAR